MATTDLVVRPERGRLSVETLGLDRVEVYANGQPTGLPDAADRSGRSQLRIPVRPWAKLEVLCFTAPRRQPD